MVRSNGETILRATWSQMTQRVAMTMAFSFVSGRRVACVVLYSRTLIDFNERQVFKIVCVYQFVSQVENSRAFNQIDICNNSCTKAITV